MMMKLGHEVILYASEDNEAECTELVTCILKSQQPKGLPEFGPDNHYFKHMNDYAILEMESRLQPKDFICLIAGLAQKPIADAYPDHMAVEFGIGYEGVFSKYQVFESYAWMHYVYGMNHAQSQQDVDGSFYHAVIPNYFEPEDFPMAKKKDDYFLFIGRLIDRKGYNIAVEVCKKMGYKLKIAGQGTPPDYGEYVGVVKPKERGELMSKARAVFVPTIYIEPFGGVHIEAMMCGTPVITTDFGAFTETFTPGVHGFRCSTFEEFLLATTKVDKLNPKEIRRHALDHYSTDVIALKYEKYFEKLLTLWDQGWYTLDNGRLHRTHG